MTISISAVIVTLNEETNIGRCIDSLSGVADEIIVLDSLSTDKTGEICRNKEGVIFIQRAWGGFSNSKNYANDLATKDYILSIDADEALSDELRQSIIEVKKNPSAIAYSFNRLTNYCGKWIHHCGWYPDTKTRLFKRGERKWTGEIHESLNFPTDQIKKIKGDLLHYSFPSIASHIRTLNSFTEVASQDLMSKNKKVSFVLHVLINPASTFIKKFILQKGFLDGYYGFVISSISSFANFIKYVKLIEIKRKNKSKLPS